MAAVVCCTPLDGHAKLLPGPVVVFEVLSSSTRRTDQVHKLREYHAVPTARCHVLIEQEGVGITVHSRLAEGPWSTTGLRAGETLDLPDIGISIPVDELYEGVAFAVNDAPA